MKNKQDKMKGGIIPKASVGKGGEGKWSGITGGKEYTFDEGKV